MSAAPEVTRPSRLISTGAAWPHETRVGVVWWMEGKPHLQCTRMGASETLARLTWCSMRIREVGYSGTPESGQPVKR